MLGKQSGVCSSDSKSSGGTSGVTFDSTMHGFTSNSADSEGSDFSVSNSFLGDSGAPVYNHSLSYPLNWFENPSSTDLLCDDLPEIGSFEDVDRMFRRNDSTFGLVDSKEDGFGWLSSEYVKGDSREASQLNFGFTCDETGMRAIVTECQCASKSYSELSEVPFSIKDGPCSQEESDSYTSLANGLDISDGKFAFTPQEQLKQLEDMEEKRNASNFGNGSNRYLGNSPYDLNQLSSGTTSLQGHPSEHVSQQLQPTGPDSFFYLQSNGSQLYSDNSQLSDQASVMFTGSTSLAPWMSSHPSNHMQFMGSSQSPSTALSGTDNGVKIHTFQSNVPSQSRNLVDQTSMQDPRLVGDQVKLCGDKLENPPDAGGVSSVIPVEPGSLQESSMMNMGVDDISLAAASFYQLQLVMEWLDLSTKLCIRDGLYRLARSAEQRLNMCGNSSGESFMAEETNNCTSVINMETGTNPIDRSIAQLLFHRPSDSSVISTHDV